MEKKSVVWLLVFFLIIIFVLTNTLDFSIFSSDFEVHSFDDEGFSSDIIFRPVSIYSNFSEDVVLYKSFFIDGFSRDYDLSFSVSNNWLKKNKIRSNDILLFVDSASGWKEISFDYSVYTDKTFYVVDNVTQNVSGIFVVAGKPSVIYEDKLNIGFAYKLGIFILILLLLFFLIYHKSSVKDARRSRQDANLQRLEKYLRKSLLAGTVDEDLKKTLVSAGWDSAVVDQSLRHVRFF